MYHSRSIKKANNNESIRFKCPLKGSASYETKANEKHQMLLDQACEDARQQALKPRKKEIYLECRTKFKKSEMVCNDEAKAYNGNRIGGAPLFYELLACEKAFHYRKSIAKNNPHKSEIAC